MGLSLEQLNTKLEDYYGRSSVGAPRFRVIFVDNEKEKRFDEFEDYYGDILIRRVREVREVYKYPWALGCYMLERYVAEPFLDKWPAMPPLPTVKNWNGYEVFYAFDSPIAKAHGVPPWNAVNMVIVMNLFRKKVRESFASVIAAEQEQKNKEIQQFIDILDDAAPYLAGQLHDGEAVTVPHKQFTGND